MIRPREPVELDALRWAIRKGRPVLIPDIDVTVCEIHGHRFCFASDRNEDPIQRLNRKGLFYEEPELAMIRAHFPQGGTFVDIGSNIGNHSLFVAAFLQPKKIISFEPNPVAYKLLLANVMLNGFGDLFDLSHIGVGISDQKAGGYAMTEQERNLGGAQMQPGKGDIETMTGDEALAKETPDFLKIDVEGMEMKALAGLQDVIARCSPTILIEVNKENYATFDKWVAAHGYDVIDTFQRYQANKNFLLRKRTDG